ncbi:MAG: M23 family metallopeptidase [Deltaproteobacteria bacterium]|nr:M23 family metallopeptidase [Deltaproteobacteria bacterium]
MASKKLTIIFLPGPTNKVRKISVSNRVLSFSILFFLCMAIGIGYIIRDYTKIKGQASELLSLKEENKFQKTQLVALTEKINAVNQKIAGIQEFDRKLKALTNINPSKEENQFLSVGGSIDKTLKTDYKMDEVHEGLVREMHAALENVENEIVITSISQKELNNFFEGQKSILSCTPSIKPVDGWLTSGFGYRISPFTKQREFHKGIDLATKVGTPVIAPADGIVVSVGKEGNYGKVIVINHGYNMKTRYAHLHKFRVKKGDLVKRGDIIGEVGISGRCTGPHLHYEVLLSSVPVNPFRYILN